MAKRTTPYDELRRVISKCCAEVASADETALRALRMAERIRQMVGAHRRDAITRLQELLLRVEEIERQRR